MNLVFGCVLPCNIEIGKQKLLLWIIFSTENEDFKAVLFSAISSFTGKVLWSKISQLSWLWG